ncbi:hypothetical protein QBC42DRAFT_275082, partial [Cladorrhinum samala]
SESDPTRSAVVLTFFFMMILKPCSAYNDQDLHPHKGVDAKPRVMFDLRFGLRRYGRVSPESIRCMRDRKVCGDTPLRSIDLHTPVHQETGLTGPC